MVDLVQTKTSCGGLRIMQASEQEVAQLLLSQ
jgi:hypothetical protein